MNNELIKIIQRIEKRPKMYFIDPNVRDLSIFLRGYFSSQSVTTEQNSLEKNFVHYFSSFVALKLTMERGESWDKLLKDVPNSWEQFFELFYEFVREFEQRGTMENF